MTTLFGLDQLIIIVILSIFAMTLLLLLAAFLGYKAGTRGVSALVKQNELLIDQYKDAQAKLEKTRDKLVELERYNLKLEARIAALEQLNHLYTAKLPPDENKDANR